MKKLLILPFILFTFFLLANKTQAAGVVTCTPIYGGGQSCVQTGALIINKTVSDPISGVFVDNLGVNDNKFAPNQAVTFQVTVTNTGAATDILVKDIFPRFVNFAAGAGNFDSNARTLSFTVSGLNTNESRSFTLTGNVVSADKLPDQNIVCDVNQAQAIMGNQVISQDNSQFCIQKTAVAVTPGVPSISKGGLKVFPPSQVVTTPATGPEALPLLALIPTGALGAFLRKRTSK